MTRARMRLAHNSDLPGSRIGGVGGSSISPVSSRKEPILTYKTSQFMLLRGAIGIYSEMHRS